MIRWDGMGSALVMVKRLASYQKHSNILSLSQQSPLASFKCALDCLSLAIVDFATAIYTANNRSQHRKEDARIHQTC